MGVTIRPAEPDDWDAIWAVLEPTIREGKTHPVPPDADRKEALAFWQGPGTRVYVAQTREGGIVGVTYIKPNHTGPSSHVANAGYVVAASARGQGIARAMCAFTLREAARQGYRCMQFNLVIATNRAALHAWQSMGFEIIGTLPEGFCLPDGTYVDAHIMWRSLADQSGS